MMKTIFCPRCRSTSINWINEDTFRCNSCGYLGTQTGKGFVKK